MQLHTTEEADRRRSREGADRAIRLTKPDWPEATSGPAVTPATERGMGEGKGEGEAATWLKLIWLWHCVIV